MQYTRPNKGHTVFFMFLLGLLVMLSVSARESPLPVAKHSQALLPTIEDIDLLSINQELKDLVDREIRPIGSKEKQTKALHSLLFTSEGRNIQYAFTDTKTAQETFDSKSGDCLSQAALYVAAARYVGLPAVFQSIKVPPNWEKGHNFYFVPGHVNVHIRLPRQKVAIVEFVRAYIGATQEKARRVSDDVVVAQYYNNKGAEALDQQNYALAIAYFKKSIAQTDRLDTPWSNLGVAYKLYGDIDNAERAYLRALRISSRNLSTITNIYQLYIATGEDKKAEKYFKKSRAIQ